MGRFVRAIVPALVFVGALLLASAAADAACVRKGGKGTGGSRDSAMFQAWEAVLQATSWGSWGSFMTSGMKVGSAPGYKVSGLTSRCSPGGLGQTCIIQATLCN
jgi:hypothetical protein